MTEDEEAAATAAAEQKRDCCETAFVPSTGPQLNAGGSGRKG